MKQVVKSWGNEFLIKKKDTKTRKILHVLKGKSIHLQHHEKKREWMRVMDGIGYAVRMKKDGKQGEMIALEEGDSIFIEKGVIHKIWAHNNSDLWIFEKSEDGDDKDVIHHEIFECDE